MAVAWFHLGNGPCLSSGATTIVGRLKTRVHFKPFFLDVHQTEDLYVRKKIGLI